MMRPAAEPQPAGVPGAASTRGAAPGAQAEARQITKTYPTRGGEVEALLPTSFTLGAGEFVSFVGPSGCGKSTLMLLMAGLLPPTSGEILVDDRPLTEPLTDVGIVFQDHLLLDFRNAEDNVLLQTQIRKLPRAESRAAAERLFERLGLQGAEHRYPQQLSGGMRQRVSLARALIHDPPMLLMDEPFGALDAITRTQMRHDLEQLWMEKRKTVMFITHSVEEAIGLSDRVIVMSPGPGRLIEEIIVDLPRPRPVELGSERAFVEYADQVYAIFRETGVLKI